MRVGKLVLVAGISLAAASAAARADELQNLKSEIEALNSRLAAVEAAPAAPEGFRLIAISEDALQDTPGAPLSARERAAYAGRATMISVLPTADAPAAASISWSGYMRAGVVYNGVEESATSKAYVLQNGAWVRDPAKDASPSRTTNDTDTGARAQLLVQARTETSVGEVGVELELRDDMDGNGPFDLYTKVAWGYWSMTPELTLGGGYNQSIGDIVYGYDGSCTCYFTDNADVDFNPGDTTQMRLSYVSGPVSFNVALEDASLDDVSGDGTTVSKGLLGVSGDIVYSGKLFSGEIAGVWRDSNKAETGASQIWQVGLGGSITMGDVGSLTFAAATGQGPYEVLASGTVVSGLAYDNSWWGASALTSIHLGDSAHMELAAGYKQRDGDQSTYKGYQVANVDYHTYALMGGLYYTPVSQLTLGLEGEWYTTETTLTATKDLERHAIDASADTVWADVVAVWSF